MKMAPQMISPPEVLVADVHGWRDWLEQHHADRASAWLVVAKKNVTEPTRLTYSAALEEAVCYGWIDGMVRGRDERTYRVRFTPRRPRSSWTDGNVALAQRLIAEARMRPAGMAAFERRQVARPPD